MKTNFNKLASYTALILLSALPLSTEALADVEKKSESSVCNDDVEAIPIKRKTLEE